MTLDPLAVVADLSRKFGLTPDDLRHLADLAGQDLPTLRQVLQNLTDRGFAPPAERYPQGLRRLLDGDPELSTDLTAYGDLSFTEFVLPRVERDATLVHRLVGAQQVALAAARSRPLAAGDPKLYGHGAAEQYVRAARAIDRALVAGNYRSGPQLTDLRDPARPGPSREKALEDDELRAYLQVVLWASTDPELDALLWVVDRVAALRMEELIGLTVTGTELDRPSVTVAGKYSKIREMPVHGPVLRRALALSAARRTRGADALWRTSTGTPVTTRRFEDWSTRLHRECSWAAGHEIRLHALRHTTAQAVQARGGEHSEGAALYLGHELGASLGTIATYLGFSDARLWTTRRRLATNTFGPLDQWPDLPENDVLADFLEMT